MAEWPKTFTTTNFAFVQDDGEPYFDRHNIGTANYPKGTRSQPERVPIRPKSGDVKQPVVNRKKK